MFLYSNLKYLRNFSDLTQAEFGKLFKKYNCEKSRSNIDSYERGNARPDEAFQAGVSKHYNIPLEVLIHKDLKLNPGLMFTAASVTDQKNLASEDVIRAKDDLIRELKAQNKKLQEQNESLIKQLLKK